MPTEVAEQLITSNWSAIKSKTNAIASALYVARDSTVTLASDALSSDPNPSNSLPHAGDYFGFSEYGYADKIKLEHLEVLRPHLQLLDSFDLAHISEFCGRNGYRNWAQNNLVAACRVRLAQASGEPGDGVLSGTLKRFFPVHEELISNLDKITATDEPRAHFATVTWAGGFSERLDDLETMDIVLSRWLGANPTVKMFRVAARAIQHQGSRRSLEMLHRFSSTDGWTLFETDYHNAEYAVKPRSLT